MLVISKQEFEKCLSKHVKLEKTSLKLHNYMGEKVKPIGVCTVTVQYGQQMRALPLHILARNGPALLGRDWLEEIKLDWKLLHLETKDDLQKLLNWYQSIFSPGLGNMKNIKARVTL